MRLTQGNLFTLNDVYGMSLHCRLGELTKKFYKFFLIGLFQ